MSTTPRTVAVFGSCITRDNFNRLFNPEHRRWYTVGAAANQSSVIALMSPPIEPVVTAADGLSDYDTWNVRDDLRRDFLGELAAAPPDLLILDFFGDVHFGVLRLPDGRYLTNNFWKVARTAQYRALVAAGGTTDFQLAADPKAYLATWTAALHEFAAFLAEHCPRTRVIVHRGFYARKVATDRRGRPDGLRRFSGLALLDAKRATRLWARLDGYAIDTFGWESIDLRKERYTSSTENPWGPFWVHYSVDYYHRFLAELHAIDLAARLDPDLAERVAAVAAASRERLRNQARFIRLAVEQQDKQVAALEHRSVLGTARAALTRGDR